MPSKSALRHGPLSNRLSPPPNGAADAIPPQRNRPRWRTPTLLIAAVAVFVSLAFGTKALHHNNKAVENLIALPEEKIDIGIAALTLARETYPNLDIPAYSAEIDAMADRVRAYVGDSTDTRRRIGALNQVIYTEDGYGYDSNAVRQGSNTPDYLNHLLDTKVGNCTSLPTLYMAVAQRLGYPIYAVSAPAHSFLRYVEPSGAYLNMEPTNRAVLHPDEMYVKDFSIGETGLASGAYMKTMTRREFVGVLLSNLGLDQLKQGNDDRAFYFLRNAVELNPTCADCYDNLGTYHANMSALAKGKDALDHFNKADLFKTKAREMGYVDLRHTPAGEKMWNEL